MNFIGYFFISYKIQDEKTSLVTVYRALIYQLVTVYGITTLH